MHWTKYSRHKTSQFITDPLIFSQITCSVLLGDNLLPLTKWYDYKSFPLNMLYYMVTYLVQSMVQFQTVGWLKINILDKSAVLPTQYWISKSSKWTIETCLYVQHLKLMLTVHLYRPNNHAEESRLTMHYEIVDSILLMLYSDSWKGISSSK